MTHLDIITQTLSEVSGIPASHFRDTMMRAIANAGRDIDTTELTRELTDEEANEHLNALRTPAAKQGVLRWLVEAGVIVNRMTPTQRYRLHALLNNQQN